PSPYGDYGGRFLRWLKEDDPQPYNSWGNGSAMRVSAIGWLYNSVEEVLCQAKLSAEISHSHPEGVKGAQAIAGAIFLARTGQPKEAIKRWIEIEFGYNLNNTVANLQQTYANGNFDYESCQDSVPQAILCFLESSDFESAIRLAISIGGDSDTIACMTGGIAEAFYKQVDKSVLNGIWDRIPLDMMLVIDEFIEKTKIKIDYRTTLRYKRQRWYRKIIATVTVIALSVW
ncbi:MAG: ADP-ribosylglycohydrolase family protein, partial [Lachnospiraceae bacterium]